MPRYLSAITTCLLLAGSTAYAAPEPFVYKKPARGAESESTMRSIYDLILNPSKSLSHARLAILTAMLETRGAVWVLEEEGPGYVLARWDYKGHSIFHRIEYNEDWVQIKYAGGLDAYECEMRSGDYCYKTHGNYYKYNLSLVNALRDALNSHVGGQQ